MRRVLAALFTAAPFVAGAIAALGARRDPRMLWMAAAATLVARLVLLPTRALRGGAIRVGAAVAAASLAAGAVAVLSGARAVFGIVAVAVVLASCAVAGAVLGPRWSAA